MKTQLLCQQSDSVCSSVPECVYVGKNEIRKKGLKGSICNEWSQLEADTTGRPPSVRLAVVVIESFVLGRRNTNEAASSSGASFVAQRGECETRVTGDEAQGYEGVNEHTSATLYSKIQI